MRWSRGFAGSPQTQKLLHCKSRFVENLSKGSGTDPLMIWHHNASIRVATPEDDVASSLSIHDEPDALKHLHQFLPGNVGG